MRITTKMVADEDGAPDTAVVAIDGGGLVRDQFFFTIHEFPGQHTAMYVHAPDERYTVKDLGDSEQGSVITIGVRGLSVFFNLEQAEDVLNQLVAVVGRRHAIADDGEDWLETVLAQDPAAAEPF
jgi:hypothetical protein